MFALWSAAARRRFSLPPRRTQLSIDQPPVYGPDDFLPDKILLFALRRMRNSTEKHKVAKIRVSNSNPNRYSPPCTPKPRASPIKKAGIWILQAISASERHKNSSTELTANPITTEKTIKSGTLAGARIILNPGSKYRNLGRICAPAIPPPHTFSAAGTRDTSDRQALPVEHA